jgi:hypothetical protein
VMGDIIPATEGVVVPPSLMSPQAQQQEALIQNVPKVHVEQFEETNDFDDGGQTAYRPPRQTLPMAAASPNWDESVEIAPMPSGIDLENLVTPPPVKLKPRAPSQDPATTLPLGSANDLATTLPMTGRKSLPAIDLNRPVQQRPSQAPFDPLRSAQNRPITPLPHTPFGQQKQPAPGTSWNIPRVVMAIAILVAIIVAVVLAFS